MKHLEDLEPEPAAAARVFGDSIERVRAFTADLARRGEELGLIGPLELPRLWTRHVLNSGLVAPLIRAGALVGDVGSGAGLPGLVLAIARPDARFVLIEPMERRTDWLRAEADALGLDNVDVVRARAEDAPYVEQLDQVTARAVSALRTLIPSVVPLVKPGGELILMKGARAEEERQAAAKQIARARLANVEILTLGEGVTTEVTRVFRALVPWAP
ncbi:MAG TPA: 16S rRNA (guanine(527)-N(7))-methyltransferase RsmG [Microbacteriaceae bacterium]|nr:16S rRNA (guanine(527)-N(7))-methyltransferase RsmG [Microbacteriaceae bacterium]